MFEHQSSNEFVENAYHNFVSFFKNEVDKAFD